MQKRFMKYISVATLTLGTVVALSQNNTVSASEGSVVRVSGETRYQTATNISQSGFEKSDTVFIANAMNFADALAGGPLAYQNDAPILLANGENLRPETLKEIKRLGAKKAVILGGEAAVSKSIDSELKKLGLSTERLAGETRFETSEIIASRLNKKATSNKAVVVDGYNFADAMSVAPFAAEEGMPIYLTRPSALPNESALKQYGETFIIGGETAVNKSVESKLNKPTRLSGINRYQTNLKVLDYFNVDSDQLFVATGTNFADALTGSSLAAKNSTGVALVREADLNLLSDYLGTQTFETYTILGGEVAVSSRISEFLSNQLRESKVVSETVVEENVVPFKAVEVETSELPIGVTNLKQEGKNGYDQVTYETTVVNGIEVRKVEKNRETVVPVDNIIEIGTRYIEISSIEILNPVKRLFVGDVINLDTKVLPTDATDSAVKYESSDDKVATVDSNGVINTLSEGTVTISVFNEVNDVKDSIDIEVAIPAIESVSSLDFSLTQYDSFELPSTITAYLDNGTEKEVAIKWNENTIDMNGVGEYEVNGVIEEYNYDVTLKLTVVKFVPNITTNSYSSITINGLSRGISLSIYNRDKYAVDIEKVEIYERGKLFNTYTPENLASSDISSNILPYENWSISVSSKLGIWVDNSFVRYTLSVNGEEYVYEDTLDR